MCHFKIVYANLYKNPNHKPDRMKNINEYPQHRHDKLIINTAGRYLSFENIFQPFFQLYRIFRFV